MSAKQNSPLTSVVVSCAAASALALLLLITPKLTPAAASPNTAASSALLSTYTVTSTNDSGDGSLRWAITQANSNPGEDTIYFNIPADTDPGCDAGTGVCTIHPAPCRR